jgi:hypothetical protein
VHVFRFQENYFDIAIPKTCLVFFSSCASCVSIGFGLLRTIVFSLIAHAFWVAPQPPSVQTLSALRGPCSDRVTTVHVSRWWVGGLGIEFGPGASYQWSLLHGVWGEALSQFMVAASPRRRSATKWWSRVLVSGIALTVWYFSTKLARSGDIFANGLWCGCILFFPPGARRSSVVCLSVRERGQYEHEDV